MKGADAECLAAGMDAYLSKPIDRTVLDTTLARFLSEAAAALIENADHANCEIARMLLLHRQRLAQRDDRTF